MNFFDRPVCTIADDLLNQPSSCAVSLAVGPNRNKQQFGFVYNVSCQRETKRTLGRPGNEQDTARERKCTGALGGGPSFAVTRIECPAHYRYDLVKVTHVALGNLDICRHAIALASAPRP